jgi:cytochrome d ubiquinol oxidase subunit I
VGDVAAGMVLSTLLAYLVVYAALIVAYVGVLVHLASKAGQPPAPHPSPSLQPAE